MSARDIDYKVPPGYAWMHDLLYSKPVFKKIVKLVSGKSLVFDMPLPDDWKSLDDSEYLIQTYGIDKLWFQEDLPLKQPQHQVAIYKNDYYAAFEVEGNELADEQLHESMICLEYLCRYSKDKLDVLPQWLRKEIESMNSNRDDYYTYCLLMAYNNAMDRRKETIRRQQLQAQQSRYLTVPQPQPSAFCRALGLSQPSAPRDALVAKVTVPAPCSVQLAAHAPNQAFPPLEAAGRKRAADTVPEDAQQAIKRQKTQAHALTLAASVGNTSGTPSQNRIQPSPQVVDAGTPSILTATILQQDVFNSPEYQQARAAVQNNHAFFNAPLFEKRTPRRFQEAQHTSISRSICLHVWQQVNSTERRRLCHEYGKARHAGLKTDIQTHLQMAVPMMRQLLSNLASLNQTGSAHSRDAMKKSSDMVLRALRLPAWDVARPFAQAADMIVRQHFHMLFRQSCQQTPPHYSSGTEGRYVEDIRNVQKALRWQLEVIGKLTARLQDYAAFWNFSYSRQSTPHAQHLGEHTRLYPGSLFASQTYTPLPQDGHDIVPSPRPQGISSPGRQRIAAAGPLPDIVQVLTPPGEESLHMPPLEGHSLFYTM